MPVALNKRRPLPMTGLMSEVVADRAMGRDQLGRGRRAMGR
ncbi:MAG: hypothetical protein ACRDL5_13120 [Solirubrobacteraceae bacterium]